MNIALMMMAMTMAVVVPMALSVTGKCIGRNEHGGCRRRADSELA
jgi:hypothetical protein